MDELLKIWKQDKINTINKQLQEIEGKKLHYDSLIDHYTIMKNEADKEKAELEAVLQKLLSFTN